MRWMVSGFGGHCRWCTHVYFGKGEYGVVGRLQCEEPELPSLRHRMLKCYRVCGFATLFSVGNWIGFVCSLMCRCQVR